MSQACPSHQIPLETADIQPAQPKLSVHTFTEKILETVVHFQVAKLSESFILWVGSTPNMDNLAMAMATKFVSCVS